MEIKDFGLHISLISITIIGLSHFFLSHLRYDLFEFSFISVVIYVVFSYSIFLIARRVSTRKSEFTFNGIVSASFTIKIIFSVVLMAYWNQIIGVEDNYHLMLYILIYFIYTAYEVYFLTILAKKPKF